MPRSDGLRAVVHDVAEHTRTLARLEAELAALELRRKAAALGFGVALVAVAALLALLALGFLLATLAAALATFLPTWLALLLVTLTLVLVATASGATGVGLLRRSTPPVPEQAIEEAKLTGAAVRGDGRG